MDNVINVFENKEAADHFYNEFQKLPLEKQPLLGIAIKDLFWKKATSEDEGLDSFKITVADIDTITNNL